MDDVMFFPDFIDYPIEIPRSERIFWITEPDVVSSRSVAFAKPRPTLSELAERAAGARAARAGGAFNSSI